jgi:hypothetical protein
MHPDPGLIRLKPPLAAIIFPPGGDHVYFMALGDQSLCHFVGAGAAGHGGGIEVLVKINYFH